MIRVLDRQITGYNSCSLRWVCDNRKVAYFEVWHGGTPKGLTLLARTYNNSLASIPLMRDKLRGETYLQIKGFNLQKNLEEELDVRITSNDISNYERYRKWFESNFLKASLSKAAGVKLALLQRRTTGKKCPRCSDDMTGEATDSRCPVCYGMGFEGGFYEPIILYGLKGAERSQTNYVGSTAPTLMENSVFVLPPYPILLPKDYLVNLNEYRLYQLPDQSSAPYRMDGERLGSITYSVNLLPSDHPVTAFPIDASMSDITEVLWGDKGLLVKGSKLRPTFGITKLVMENTEHTDPTTADEVILYDSDIVSVTGEQLVFSVPDRWRETVNRVKLVLNNLFFGPFDLEVEP